MLKKSFQIYCKMLIVQHVPHFILYKFEFKIFNRKVLSEWSTSLSNIMKVQIVKQNFFFADYSSIMLKAINVFLRIRGKLVQYKLVVRWIYMKKTQCQCMLCQCYRNYKIVFISKRETKKTFYKMYNNYNTCFCKNGCRCKYLQHFFLYLLLVIWIIYLSISVYQT